MLGKNTIEIHASRIDEANVRQPIAAWSACHVKDDSRVGKARFRKCEGSELTIGVSIGECEIAKIQRWDQGVG